MTIPLLISEIEKEIVCPYCKKVIPLFDISVDHILPKSRGGTNDKENLQYVDMSCNYMKGNLLDSEFKDLMNFLSDKPEMYKILKTRLKIGGFVFRRK